MNDFNVFREPSWDGKSIKINPKRHRENDAKKQGTKMANKTAKSILDSQEEPYTFFPPSPSPRGVRTNFRDLDPVWERERERVNRDALTRLKTLSLIHI